MHGQQNIKKPLDNFDFSSETSLSFIAASSTVTLSERKRPSAGTSRDSCGAQDSDKRNALQCDSCIYPSYIFIREPLYKMYSKEALCG